jgi:phosphoribosylformylglycinamidine synthase subunit PurS
MNLKFSARIDVIAKPELLDPQAKAIKQALAQLGYQEISQLRQGKYFEITFTTTSRATAQTLLVAMAEKLLANPIVEDYHIEITSEEEV